MRLSLRVSAGVAKAFAATFEQQSLDAELLLEHAQCPRQIDLRSSGENVGDAITAQLGQMIVRHAFA